METNSINTVFSGYPDEHRSKLKELRDLIRKVGDRLDEVTGLEESLKWGQPSFTAKPKGLGSSVRLDKRDEGVSVYFICNTGLVDQFREIYPDKFNYVGNREIHFALGDDLQEDELSHCIAMALMYHANKKELMYHANKKKKS